MYTRCVTPFRDFKRVSAIHNSAISWSCLVMRLLTWNINGIRTLPLYHPWNTLKTGENILNELGADIICFQEMKSSRQALEKSVALPETYDAFFSFPTAKGGYSGVGVFTKSSQVVPLKAEEGLSGRLQSGLKPPLSLDERVTQSPPYAHEMVLVEDEVTNTHNDLSELDREGRALILDFGLFVLINLYCPNETSDTRLPYKMNFHLLLAERVRRLVEVDKREVIVTGDINICAAPIDHCDGELASNKDDFWVHPARKWFREWLSPVGPMVDVVRSCWPDRKGMYTCWNQKIDARVSNYGTRIDYFLLTKGLLPWFKHGDIQPTIKGSDHCPVYIDLQDQIVDGNGKTLFLKDMMMMGGEKREPPRLATKYWDEYSGKQKLLSSFFGKKGSQVSKSDSLKASTLSISQTSATTPTSSGASLVPGTNFVSVTDDFKPDILSPIISLDLSEHSPNPSSSPTDLDASSSSKNGSASPVPVTTVPSETPAPLKRKKMQADSNYPAQTTKKSKKNISAPKGKTKGVDTAVAQMKLSSFFAGPTASKARAPSDDREDNSSSQPEKADIIDVDALLDDSSDMPSQSQSPSSQPFPTLAVPGSSQGKNSHAWSALFARIEPPRCLVHREPAREFRVNKPSPNKGKAFFICARPVGPGYDAGRDKRRREEVDSQYRCNFFKWSSEVKKEALREAEIKGAK